MKKKKYETSVAFEFLTREQLIRSLGLPRRTVDRLVARGELTQYRSGPGIGKGGQRVFYSRAQVQRVKARLRGQKKRVRRARR